SNKKQTTIKRAFEIFLSKPYNTTEQAICDKAITKYLRTIKNSAKRGNSKGFIKIVILFDEIGNANGMLQVDNCYFHRIETIVSDIIEVLKPFSDITNYISGSLYSTMSIIYLTISSLYNFLLKEFLEFLDISIDTLDKIDLDITDNINIFDEKASEDKELEQIKFPAMTNKL
ncbi:20600_t:CDS:2, partial [Racocetra persica]